MSTSDDVDQRTWSERFREQIRLAGLSRQALADRIGVNKGTVDAWAQGRVPHGVNLLAVERELPGMRVGLEVSPVTGIDPRDPNGYAVHLPMDPARRARVLATLLQEALEEQSGR